MLLSNHDSTTVNEWYKNKNEQQTTDEAVAFMNRAPQPGMLDHVSRAQVWIAGGLFSAAILGVGIRQALPDGEPAAHPVAAAEGTMPKDPIVTAVPQKSTEAPLPEAEVATTAATTTTQPEDLNIDGTTTTTSSTTTAAPPPSPPPSTTSAPPATPAPETTTPTTTPEVDQPFNLPEFSNVSPEQYEQLGQDTVYVDLGDSGCSGRLLRAEGRIIGGVSAVHCLPLTYREVDGRQVIDHYGSVTLQQGDQADRRTVVSQIDGVLVPDGPADTLLLVGRGEDPAAVQRAYNELIAPQKPQQGDVAIVSGWPDKQHGMVDTRQAQQLLYIGTQQNVIDDGRSYGTMDIWVAGTTPDGATMSEGYSGAQLVFGNGLSGTVSLGKEIVREPGIFGVAERYSELFDVDLNRPDITSIVFTTPVQPLETTYFALNNTNRSEVYAEEIAAIKAEAYTALQDDAKPKSYISGVLQLDSDYAIGGTVSSKIEEALFHVDQAGNTLIYGRDPAAVEDGMGMMLFIPAAQEARLQLRSATPITAETLLNQTNGDVQPVATMSEYPDFLNAYAFRTADGIERTIGEGLQEWPADATLAYEISISHGQVTLVEVAVGEPPVPDITTP